MQPKKKSGDTVPSVTFKARDGGSWVDVTTDELFGGKTVVVFSLPGAFTPTCSSSHVPRYDQLAAALQAKGVDEIVCVSVNDGFVMEAWAADQGVSHVRFIPDGNGEFTRQMGMLVDKKVVGFGDRSWRYSMLVKDKKIDKLFIEPEVEGDPFEVSDADTMLEYLGGSAPADIVLFGRPTCGHCAKARAALEAKGLEYREIEADPRTLRAVAGAKTTPQVFIDGKHIGDSQALDAWLKSL